MGVRRISSKNAVDAMEGDGNIDISL